MLLCCSSCTKLPHTVNAFMCLFCECDVWNNFTAKWNPACMRFPQALSNQCSSNRIHATRLHLNTSLLSWLFNSLLLSLARTDSPAPICLALCSLSPLILCLCCFCVLSSVTLSSLSLLLPTVKCSGLAAAQLCTTWHSFYFSDSHRLQYCHYCCLVGCFFFSFHIRNVWTTV